MSGVNVAVDVVLEKRGLIRVDDMFVLAVRVVKSPALRVVAPTVPLMLIEAVPVRFVTTPLAGVPSAGVTNVGLLAKTNAPVPVSSVTAEAKLAEDGVAKNVATPEPKPEMPVDTGRPVALVRVAEDGVPKAGVTSIGLVARTLFPVPVFVTLTTFLLASRANAVEAVRPDRVVVPLTDRLVKAPDPEVLLTLIKSVPFHATTADSPLTIVTPVVGPTPRNTIDCVPPDALITV